MKNIRRVKKNNVFQALIIIESLILFSIGLFSNIYKIYPDVIICSLLFTMGLQNSFVTRISNAIVRTTHLTGLFTDLGIDISQLFFKKGKQQRAKIKMNIQLRVYIITFFFAGGLIGGFFYSRLNLGLNTLIVGALILLTSLFFDASRYQYLKTKRKLKQRRAI